MFMKSRAEEIRDELGDLTAQINAAEARRIDLLAELDDLGGWGGIGIRSIGHWASLALGLTPRHTNELLACGRAVRELPAIGGALAVGELSIDKVAAVARVATPASEPTWLHVARTASATHVCRVAARYATVCRSLDAESGHPRPRRDEALSFNTEDDGMVRLLALLEPDNAAIVRPAIESVMEAEWRDGDNRDEPAAVRAAHALVALAETALAVGPRSLDGGDRTTVVLHVDADLLAGARGDGRCHFAGANGPARVDTARRLACDAMLLAITERDGSPVDVGRARRIVSRAQRRALEARDGGCAFPGCGATRFLDAHHIDHWVDGGATDLENLVLLCRRHHRLHHEGGYRIERQTSGGLRWLTANGHDVVPRLRRVATRPTDLRDRQRAAGFRPTWLTPHAKDPRSSTANETLDGLLKQRPPPPRDPPAA